MLGVFGMWLASIGTDPLTGTQRLNFGTIELMKGFDIVPVLIGLFGIAEVLASLEQKIEQIYAGKLGSCAVDDPARRDARARAGGLRARHGDRLRAGAAAGHAAGADRLSLLRRRAADLAGRPRSSAPA